MHRYASLSGGSPYFCGLSLEIVNACDSCKRFMKENGTINKYLLSQCGFCKDYCLDLLNATVNKGLCLLLCYSHF